MRIEVSKKKSIIESMRKVGKLPHADYVGRLQQWIKVDQVLGDKYRAAGLIDFVGLMQARIELITAELASLGVGGQQPVRQP